MRGGLDCSGPRPRPRRTACVPGGSFPPDPAGLTGPVLVLVALSPGEC
ncbi:hypothetical protein SSAG_06427 [Streptomyces sp. Mg1]|nr:hypothetical protein SSAG_06427 [Streptomyces sp. Mg1]